MTCIPTFVTPAPLTCLVVCSLAACLIGCGKHDRESAETITKSTFAIFATCDTQGWIEPCGCASGQSGGLSRRATLIDQLAGEDDRLLVSVGGAAMGSQPYDVAKFHAIVAGEEQMGYQVHNIGVSEIGLPLPRTEGLTFVSTNLSHVEAGVESSISITKGGWRILVLGVVSPSLVGTVAEVETPDRAILKAIDDQKEPHDCIVVLAYMNQDELRDLAASVPEVDVIIGGKTGQSIAPTQFGRTLLTAVSNKGKFVARIRSGKESLDWKADLHEVSSEYEEDRLQQVNLKAFRQQLTELDFAASQTSFVSAPSRDDNQFVGSDACQSCHEEDTEIWKSTTHAHAWKTLEDASAHVDSSCQRCHTVGFGGAGGFVNRQSSMNRVDVGCESCHGPSSKHVADATLKTPWLAADSCLACHDHENSPHFEYDSYWQQVAHGNTESTDANR